MCPHVCTSVPDNKYNPTVDQNLAEVENGPNQGDWGQRLGRFPDFERTTTDSFFGEGGRPNLGSEGTFPLQRWPGFPLASFFFEHLLTQHRTPITC